MQDEEISVGLTNKDVWKLIKLQKWLNSEDPITLTEGIVHNYELQSNDHHNSFILDVRRGRIELKYTIQMRASTAIPLIRFDVGGPHKNPNVKYHVEPDDPFYVIHDKCIGMDFCDKPHIHIYREGFEDRWAYPIDGLFDNKEDIELTFKDFLVYCNINGKYVIQEVLNDSFRRDRLTHAELLGMAERFHVSS